LGIAAEEDRFRGLEDPAPCRRRRRHFAFDTDQKLWGKLWGQSKGTE
jgi:hypothetical protein